jgi:hypothetical protein
VVEEGGMNHEPKMFSFEESKDRSGDRREGFRREGDCRKPQRQDNNSQSNFRREGGTSDSTTVDKMYKG